MKSNSMPMSGALIMVFLVALSGCQSPSSLPKEFSSEGDSSVFSNEVSSSSDLEAAVSSLGEVEPSSTGTQSEAESAEKEDSEQSPAAIGERGSVIDGQGIAGLTFLFGTMGIAMLTYKLFGGDFGKSKKEEEQKLKEKEANSETAELESVSEVEAPLPESCDEKTHVNEIIEQASNDQGS